MKEKSVKSPANATPEKKQSKSRPVASPELTSTPYFPAEFRLLPHINHMQMHRLIILCFLFTSTAAAAAAVSDVYDPNRISINCGGASPATALNGKRWSGDVVAEGSSTASTVKGGLITAVDSVPYKTARVSRSRFSYSFRITPGQKFIRLHFNPSAYHGFESFDDLFTVEAGPFTLLANFSASIAARALSVNVVVKEFCIIVQENQPFDILFSPEISPSRNNYAFINGIEITSVPSTVSYCHGGDSGIQVLGQKSVIYIDNNTVLERVYHQNMKGISALDDIDGMFGTWALYLKKHANKGSNLSWGVSVDVGFRYLVRIHLCEVGHKMDFTLLIDNMIALTSAYMLKKGENQSILWYNYMVMVEGHKREGKRVISVSLNSHHEFLNRHGALEGFEVFKLSNHDRSLSSPNPLPPRGDSPSYTIQSILYSLLGRRNAIATAFFTLICMVNIILHLLHKTWIADEPDMAEEEDEPVARIKQLCRRFSLAEIQSATQNFHEGSVIGKGGFGKVYKGFIDDGRELVAIKRSKPHSKDFQFWTEVETLSELRHLNLVSLIGYCIEQKEMIIVYEYMVYGSLADHLYKLERKSRTFYPLTWKQRLKICIGASRALDYLHTGHGIIHRDVKSSNILLDEKLVAKVSDFGLAKTQTSSESQSQESTNFRGTFGYIDPDYFKTHKLTKKSDTYSFGVVLLEVLCGRRAVEPSNEEDERSLTAWATENISKGQVDCIVAPSLRGEISKDSLDTFLKVAERCLHDDPKKRPAMMHIVIKLELALLQQERAESSSSKEWTGAEDIFSSTEKYHKEKKHILEPNEKINVDDALPQKENMRSPSQNEIGNVTDIMRYTDNDIAILSVDPRPMTTSFNVKTDMSSPRAQSNTTMINSGRKHEKKSMMHRISQKLWPMDAFWKTRKSSNKMELVVDGISVSAPVSHKTNHITSHSNTITKKSEDRMRTMVPIEKRNDANDASTSQVAGEILPQSSLRVFTFPQLKAATRNFRPDSVLGEGGFGTVFKGWIHEKSSGTTVIAVKKLNAESTQGYMEWQSEINFLGRLSHPNLVKLLGYCWEDKELLLVYEYMDKGSLENRLFKRGLDSESLPWDIRLKIMIGAARGMAFLHASENQVIYRDFKTSNILLDESYHAKLSDFGLAKIGPTGGNSHVSTGIVGTYGYAAPEYVATGHLYVKSDVYGFGVVLLEMLTGMRALDINRPSGQQNLVDWMKPSLSNRRKLKHAIDLRLKETYPFKSAVQIAQLTLNCLQPEPKRRPSMQEVVDKLEEIASATHSHIPTDRRVHFSNQQHL